MQAKQILSILFGLLFSTQVALANSLNDILSRDNLLDFFQNLGWLNWAVYIGIFVVVYYALYEALKKTLPNEKMARVLSIFVSFMSVTGFTWMLVESDTLPTYLVLVFGELFVLALAGIFILSNMKLYVEDDPVFKHFRWIGIFIAAFVVNAFHSSVANSNLMSQIGPDSILGQMINFHISIGFITALIIFGVLLIFFAGGKTYMAKGSSSSGKIISNYLRKRSEREKNTKKRENLYSRMNQTFSQLNQARRQ